MKPSAGRSGQKSVAPPPLRLRPVHGTRVLPLYLFSLAGMPQGLRFQSNSMYAAFADATVVLQVCVCVRVCGVC